MAEIELATADDRNFILQTWLNGYRDSPHVRGMPRPLYYAMQGARVRELLECSKVLVMRPEAGSLALRGWIAGESGAVHYVYVKDGWRKQGVGTALLNAFAARVGKPTRYTHLVLPGSRWLERKGLRLSV